MKNIVKGTAGVGEINEGHSTEGVGVRDGVLNQTNSSFTNYSILPMSDSNTNRWLLSNQAMCVMFVYMRILTEEAAVCKSA